MYLSPRLMKSHLNDSVKCYYIDMLYIFRFLTFGLDLQSVFYSSQWFYISDVRYGIPDSTKLYIAVFSTCAMLVLLGFAVVIAKIACRNRKYDRYGVLLFTRHATINIIMYSNVRGKCMTCISWTIHPWSFLWIDCWQIRIRTSCGCRQILLDVVLWYLLCLPTFTLWNDSKTASLQI